MSILTMNSALKGGKYDKKAVSEIVGIKGAIFSLIKEGYQFNDEVLQAAHITKVTGNAKSCSRISGEDRDNVIQPMKKDTSSIKKIISDLNVLDGIGKPGSPNEEDWTASGMEDVDEGDE